MKPRKVTCFESFLLVRGSLKSMLDMLRYDSCFPATEHETNLLVRGDEYEPGLIVLCRRSGANLPATEAKWRSHGCEVIGEFLERFEAEDRRVHMIEANP
jgi:hypothetical protein